MEARVPPEQRTGLSSVASRRYSGQCSRIVRIMLLIVRRATEGSGMLAPIRVYSRYQRKVSLMRCRALSESDAVEILSLCWGIERLALRMVSSCSPYRLHQTHI